MSVYRLVDGMGDTGMVVGGAIFTRAFEADASQRGRSDEALEVVDPDTLLESRDLRHAVVEGLSHALDRRISTEFEQEQAAREQERELGSHIGEEAMRDGTGTIGFGE